MWLCLTIINFSIIVLKKRGSGKDDEQTAHNPQIKQYFTKYHYLRKLWKFLCEFLKNIILYGFHIKNSVFAVLYAFNPFFCDLFTHNNILVIASTTDIDNIFQLPIKCLIRHYRGIIATTPCFISDISSFA